MEHVNIPLYDQQQPKSPDHPENANLFGDITKKLYLDQTAHPVACFSTFAFKVLGCIFYIFFSWFSTNYIMAFIFVVIFQAVDFWVVKNITGRLLMGLRWWSVNQPDGTEKWIFESRNTEFNVNKVDYYFFWGSLVSNFIFWAVFGFFNLISFQFRWLTINSICLMLLGTNMLCFYKCSKDHQQKLSKFKAAMGTEIAKRGFTTLLSNAMGGSKA